MRKVYISLLIIITALSLTSCVTDLTSSLPFSFSNKNIMKIHQGMSSDEILVIFGEPKSISSSICGRSPNQWACTTWKYGHFPYENASFTFSGDHGSYILNNFKIDRD